jgi:WD40 repeat protein
VRDEHLRQTVNALGFSPDGKILLTGGSDSAAKLWSSDTGKPLGTLEATSASTGVVAVSPDGKSIAVGNGRKIVIWNMQSGKPTRELPGHVDAVHALAFNHDGTVLGSISSAEG